MLALWLASEVSLSFLGLKVKRYNLIRILTGANDSHLIGINEIYISYVHYLSGECDRKLRDRLKNEESPRSSDYRRVQVGVYI